MNFAAIIYIYLDFLMKKNKGYTLMGYTFYIDVEHTAMEV